MHRLTYVERAALAVLAIAALFVISPPAAVAADAQTLAGTYVTWLQIAPGVRLPSLQTYHSDGTWICSESMMFGGVPGNTYRFTPCHGVWERTGPGAFAITGMGMVFDGGSGLLIGFTRARATASFTSNEANQLSGAVRLELLLCPSPFACPDPLAADAQWLPAPAYPPSMAVVSTRLRLAQ